MKQAMKTAHDLFRGDTMTVLLGKRIRLERDRDLLASFHPASTNEEMLYIDFDILMFVADVMGMEHSVYLTYMKNLNL